MVFLFPSAVKLTGMDLSILSFYVLTFIYTYIYIYIYIPFSCSQAMLSKPASNTY